MNFDLIFGEDRTEQRERNFTGTGTTMVLSRMHMPEIPFVDEEKADPVFEVVCELADGSKKTFYPEAKSGDQARVKARKLANKPVKKIVKCSELPKSARWCRAKFP